MKRKELAQVYEHLHDEVGADETEKKHPSLCFRCKQKLTTRESEASTMLVCINSQCDNYWIKEGSEIIMLLK